MRPTPSLLNAAKKGSGISVPVELTPLFAAVAVAVGSACFFTYRHFAHDKELRLWKNPNLSTLDEVLDKSTKK
ncbi:hypothetical protein JA1_000524 [Spathaspora sp. JA1]|nr:hypothetical protein JA1_000524 [Spathaspora sp. JA1]